MGWDRLATNIEVIETPGTHFSLLEEPCVHVTLQHVLRLLEEPCVCSAPSAPPSAASHVLEPTT